MIAAAFSMGGPPPGEADMMNLTVDDVRSTGAPSVSISIAAMEGSRSPRLIQKSVMSVNVRYADPEFEHGRAEPSQLNFQITPTGIQLL
jgi:hypothetical protein